MTQAKEASLTNRNGIFDEFTVDNEAIISGILMDKFSFSHASNDGRNFYKSRILVKRISDRDDIVPIIIPENLLPKDAYAGMFIELQGYLNSYNRFFENGKRSLEIYVYPHSLHVYENENELKKIHNSNKIFLNGIIVKKDNIRETPFGKTIRDIMVKVPRLDGKKPYYFPCIAWEYTAMRLKDYNVGDNISFIGRFQSREYFKKYGLDESEGEYRTAYEISIMKLKNKKNSKIGE